MTVGETETNPVMHNTVIIEGTIPITVEKTAPECHYTINYNYPDQYCLRKFLTNVTLPIFKTITTQTTDYLNTENIEVKSHEKVLPVLQNMHYELHHITALQIFGLKKIQITNKNQHRSWENQKKYKTY